MLKKVNTAEIGVNALNHLIARIEGVDVVQLTDYLYVFPDNPDEKAVVYSPASDHGHAGRLKDAYGISVVCVPRAVNGHDWKAFCKDSGTEFFSHDSLLAAMRAFVHLHYGHTVEVPVELCD